MIKIEIIFNSNSFKEDYNEKKIILESSENLNIFSDIENISFNNRNELKSLFDNVKGTDTNSLKVVFYEKNLIKWANAKYYEQQALKSMGLIYDWLELGLLNPDDIDISKNFFNEFIIDWNYKPGNQNSLYLIDSRYTQNLKNIDSLNKLVQLNLLCKVILNNGAYENYFIPLMTPGVPIEYFKTAKDLSGNATQKIWKNLLSERSLRIDSWLKNRF